MRFIHCCVAFQDRSDDIPYDISYDRFREEEHGLSRIAPVTLLSWAMLLLLVIIAAGALDLFLGIRRLERLAMVPPRGSAGAPLVSIVVAAKDEERDIEIAMRSLLAQRYAP